MSVDSIFVQFKFENGSVIGHLKKHLAPRVVTTLSMLLDQKPLNERAIKRPGHIVILIKLGAVSIEKSTKELKTGDIAYWPLSKAFVIAFRDVKMSSAVGKIGNIIKEDNWLDTLKHVRSASPVQLSKVFLDIDDDGNVIL